MKKKDVAVLDFGSGKIVCMIGSKDRDGFIVKATGILKYSGFSNSAWIEPINLDDEIATVIRETEKRYGQRIDTLLVGVPGEFACVSTNSAKCVFKSKRKVTRDDLDYILNQAGVEGGEENLIPITQSVISYTLDDGTVTLSPIGMQANSIEGLISTTYITKYFADTVGVTLDELGIQYSYMSANLAEFLFLLPQELHIKQSILIDIGFLTTSVMLAGGDGLLFLKSFSVGSGHIVADIYKVTRTTFSNAEQLYKRANLNLKFSPTDIYVLPDGYETKAEHVNDIIRARLDDIAKYIIACFDSYPEEISESTPLFITGGGVTYLKGGVDYLSAQLGKRLIAAKTLDPMKNKPELASAFGLVSFGTDNKNIYNRN